ncbi:hypothetical protein CKM354_000350300 [Cercospora kikuchii]|uniref:Uncharacterized protein n=1 Tax=Cercospora kikuchii TaxID=84275 RepID=A0A9P3CCB6_9PEZI|nr:uncharacterized protein CKM354_000350300 [Cercospora kikuchii]GIZ40151.1 hypothetical protein CKM354_000350300 [Cercospora kikuchii]
MASDAAAPYINENYNVHTNTIRIGNCTCATPSVVQATFDPDTSKISIHSLCTRKKGHTYTQTKITAELAALDPPRKKPRKSALEGRLQTEYNARSDETDADQISMVQDNDFGMDKEEPLNEITGALVYVPAASRALTPYGQIDSASTPDKPPVRNALAFATHPVYIVQN